jgi:hypothetical protein
MGAQYYNNTTMSTIQKKSVHDKSTGHIWNEAHVRRSQPRINASAPATCTVSHGWMDLVETMIDFKMDGDNNEIPKSAICHVG